jgi:hypothetical protein
MFAAEFEPAQTPSRWQSRRTPVSIDGEIGRDKLARALCRVVDVSLHGARLATYTRLLPGSTILLTLPQVGAAASEVMWADDFSAGCRFLKAMTQNQLDLLLGLST